MKKIDSIKDSLEGQDFETLKRNAMMPFSQQRKRQQKMLEAQNAGEPFTAQGGLDDADEPPRDTL